MCKINDLTAWIEDLLGSIKNESNPEAIKLLENCGKCCAIRHNAIESTMKLRESTSNCHTRAEFASFLNERLPVTFTEVSDGIVMHLGKDKCSCPMSPEITKNSDALCYCTLGHNKAVWSTFFGKPVQIDTVETILRGGNDCVFKIKI